MALISLVFDKKVTLKIYFLSWSLQEIKLKNVLDGVTPRARYFN